MIRAALRISAAVGMALLVSAYAAMVGALIWMVLR